MPIIPQNMILQIEEKIDNLFVNSLLNMDKTACEVAIEELIQILHDNIDDKKRISYGITYVIKILSKIFYQNAKDAYPLGVNLYKNMSGFRGRCVGLGILSHVGIERPSDILAILAEAATSSQWEIKEFVQMFVRKITKTHPEKTREFLLKMAVSASPDKRRFASECLRPVAENRWINENPEFSLSVLRLLFEESDPFPRVSVGNNLSDLSRKNPELVFSVVSELMELRNKNSAFIAHRACRNLVVNDPIRVMDILECDEYKYKNKVYKREKEL